ncbi:uncharacterized protein LOC119583017 [Penaeus monodon]|uniref:uncharacterized protein LOC119583017 n=1 Tax=Penaeus monodon TaxID=6687 RepID=UPI0018A7CE48|nr:uncharacterized protein LOC119583017 [Penaeus monodon]
MDILDLSQAPMRWVFAELVEILRASHQFTIRYHPQANGLVERTNRVVKAALRAVVGEHPGNWHKYIPELWLALNSAIHRTTGEQPLYLLTGRHGYFPVGLTNEAIFDENSTFQQRLKTARRAAVEASKNAREVYGKSFEVQHLDTGKVLRAHLNHLRPYKPSEELAYADDEGDPDELLEDNDPWVTVLTSCVWDPEFMNKLE